MKKIAIILSLVLAMTAFSAIAVQSESKTQEELLNTIPDYTVQVGLEFTRFFQPYSWSKVERSWEDGKPDKCEDEPDLDMCQDYIWEKEEGEWQEEKQTFYCSGHIIYSGENMDWPHTLIGTNAHCIIYFLDKKRSKYFGSSRFDTVEVFKPKDVDTSGVGSSWKLPEYDEDDPDYSDVRPIGRQYIEINDKKPIIKHRKDQQYTVHAELLDYDFPLDYAILKLHKDVFGLPNADFGSTPEVGQEVWIAGAPLAIPFSYDSGKVNQVHLDLAKGDTLNVGWQNQLKLDIAGAPGSSGSAIYNKQGKIAGVLHGSFVYGSWGSIEGGQLALDVADIKEWLRWNGYAYAVEYED